MDITYYSIHCPRCNVIENILSEKKIKFKFVDDNDEIIKIADEHNFEFAPFAIIDGVWYDTKMLQEWVKDK